MGCGSSRGQPAAGTAQQQQAQQPERRKPATPWQKPVHDPAVHEPVAPALPDRSAYSLIVPAFATAGSPVVVFFESPAWQQGDCIGVAPVSVAAARETCGGWLRTLDASSTQGMVALQDRTHALAPGAYVVRFFVGGSDAVAAEARLTVS